MRPVRAIGDGAGRVTVEFMSDKAPAFDTIYPELMVADGEIDLTKTSCNVVGCGMGFPDKARKRLAACHRCSGYR